MKAEAKREEGASTAFLRSEVRDLFDAYASAIDEGNLDGWVDFFTEDAFYAVVPRENWERNLPIGFIRCESRGMLKDRVVAIRETMMYAPHQVRHFVSGFRIEIPGEERIRAEANYCILRTMTEAETEVFLAGRYVAELVRDGDGQLRFHDLRCITDTVVVPNSIIYPV